MKPAQKASDPPEPRAVQHVDVIGYVVAPDGEHVPYGYDAEQRLFWVADAYGHRHHRATPLAAYQDASLAPDPAAAVTGYSIRYSASPGVPGSGYVALSPVRWYPLEPGPPGSLLVVPTEGDLALSPCEADPRAPGVYQLRGYAPAEGTRLFLRALPEAEALLRAHQLAQDELYARQYQELVAEAARQSNSAGG